MTATRDDIRVTVTLQRNPLPAGELSWVKTKVENIGDTNVTWFHGGCATPVGSWAASCEPIGASGHDA